MKTMIKKICTIFYAMSEASVWYKTTTNIFIGKGDEA